MHFVRRGLMHMVHMQCRFWMRDTNISEFGIALWRRGWKLQWRFESLLAELCLPCPWVQTHVWHAEGITNDGCRERWVHRWSGKRAIASCKGWTTATFLKPMHSPSESLKPLEHSSPLIGTHTIFPQIDFSVHWGNMHASIHLYHMSIIVSISRSVCWSSCLELGWNTEMLFWSCYGPWIPFRFPSGIIRWNWNGTEKISMAPAQAWHA